MAERIESSCEGDGVGDSSLVASERVVRDVICDFDKSRNEMLHPKRWRRRSLGRRYREKKPETSTFELLLRNMNDTILFDLVSSPWVTIEETTELRSAGLLPRR